MYFTNKGRESLNNKVNLKTECKHKKSWRLLCRHNEIKKGYQPVSTSLKVEKGDLASTVPQHLE